MATAGMIQATDMIANEVLSTAPMPTARARKVAIIGPASHDDALDTNTLLFMVQRGAVMYIPGNPQKQHTCDQACDGPNTKHSQGACLPRGICAAKLDLWYLKVHAAGLERLQRRLLPCLSQLLLGLLNQPLALLKLAFLEHLLALCKEPLCFIQAFSAFLEEIILEEGVPAPVAAAHPQFLSGPAKAERLGKSRYGFMT